MLNRGFQLYLLQPCALYRYKNLLFYAFIGENGEPVYHDLSEEREAKSQLHAFGFNMVVSDKIAMNRSIPDTRLDEYV